MVPVFDFYFIIRNFPEGVSYQLLRRLWREFIPGPAMQTP